MPKPVIQFLTIFFVLFASVNFAISSDTDEMYVKRFKGWEGVAFGCVESSNIKNSLCTSIQTDAEYLAITSGIKFSKTEDFFEGFDLQDKKNYLMLLATIDLVAASSTNTRCSTCGYFVHLTAYAYYVNGIDTSSDNLPDSPVTIPRSGSFVLWEEFPGSVFTGPWESGRGTVINSVEEKLKKFFILFMKANPK